MAALLPDLPDLRHVIVIDDESEASDVASDALRYEDALAGQLSRA